MALLYQYTVHSLVLEGLVELIVPVQGLTGLVLEGLVELILPV